MLVHFAVLFYIHTCTAKEIFTRFLELEQSYAHSKLINASKWEEADLLLQDILTGGDIPGKRENVRLFLYPDATDRSYHEEINGDNFDSLIQSQFKWELPTKIFIHGFGHGYNCSFPQELKDAYLSLGVQANLVTVDWGPLSMDANAPSWVNKFKNYIVAAENVPVVGNKIGDFISQMLLLGSYSPASVHIIGFSLGAHAAGYAGQRVLETTQEQVGRISGLDPAGPLYATGLVGRHLTSNDALYVDFIHTDMGQSGTTYSLGHSNYFVNGGRKKQPGCVSKIVEQQSLADKLPIALLGSCSHSTAPLYWAQSVIREHDFIYATECSSYLAYKAKLCFRNNNEMFGEFSLSETRGDYHLDLSPQDRSGEYFC